MQRVTSDPRAGRNSWMGRAVCGVVWRKITAGSFSRSPEAEVTCWRGPVSYRTQKVNQQKVNQKVNQH